MIHTIYYHLVRSEYNCKRLALSKVMILPSKCYVNFLMLQSEVNAAHNQNMYRHRCSHVLHCRPRPMNRMLSLLLCL